MPETYFVSDTHFGHKNVLTFASADDPDKLMRPQFVDIDHMNEYLIQMWNGVVKPADKVIHCGDVAFGKDALQLCHRLNGIKYLVLGNHDTQNIAEYSKIFVKIFGAKYIGRNTAICTHIPIHPSSLRDFQLCIHGHLHDKTIGDPRYFNVSVEQIGYKPISLDEILSRISK